MIVDLIQSPLGTAILVASTLGGIAFLTLIVSFPHRLSAGQSTDHIVRIFRNSAVPIVSQLAVRGVDLVVAIAILRLLGPSGNGQYALAVIIWLYVKTVSDFGLGLYATREVARDHDQAGWLIGATTMFRWAVLALALVPVTIYIGARTLHSSDAWPAAIATAILLLSIVPSSYSEAINSALNGFERMEVAAWINIGVSVIRAPLAVLLGATTLGVAGVALAALVTAAASAIAFHFAYRAFEQSPIHWNLNKSRAMRLARESWPLLVNALLVSLFFRVDIFLVDAFHGSTELGIYDAAYKFINLLTIVPAYATLAVFPLLTQRVADREAFVRAQRVTTYLLVTLGWFVVAVMTPLAGYAIAILAGDAYLPDAAGQLRILVWFAPISFLNGVYQYVLVARGLQRRIVPVFLTALIFNFAANIALVPFYGAYAAAANTVATEVVIFLAFAWVSRSDDTAIFAKEIIQRLWRPTIAGLGGAVVALIALPHAPLAFLASMATVLSLGILFRVVGEDEIRIMRRLLRREAPSADQV